VGSNSVIIKAVPDGATVVGIPGRVVGAQDAQSAERTKIANKMGFVIIRLAHNHVNWGFLHAYILYQRHSLPAAYHAFVYPSVVYDPAYD
jgi:hypothetical protein